MLPGAGVVNAEEFGRRILALCDDFRSHSAKSLKAFNRGHHMRRRILKWIIMKGGITPVGKSLDRMVNKVFKGYLRELYDIFALIAPVNRDTGAPSLPFPQQISTWIVKVWDQVP